MSGPKVLDTKMKESGLFALKRGLLDIKGGLNLVALGSAHFQTGGYEGMAQSAREHMCEMYDTMKAFEEFLKKLEASDAKPEEPAPKQ